VGRDVEIAHLRRVLGQAGSGSGQVIALVGEAGVGKSRLTYEFTHSHRVQDWLILEAASLSYGKATSYLPVIEMLRGYFTIGDRDDQREMRAKVLGRVLELDRALEPLVPPLLSLLDLRVEDVGWQTLDPPQRRQRTLDAVKRLLLREAQSAAAAIGLRGSTLDRQRDTGPARLPYRELGVRTPATAGEPSPRISTWLGEQDVLHADTPGSASGQERQSASCTSAQHDNSAS
jgi:AAA ATPase domain